MGKPPQRVVYQKLIRRYFKKTSTFRSEEAASYRNDLYSCWDKHGIDHPKCEHLIKNFDKGWALEMNNRERFAEQTKMMPSVFNNMIAPLPDKMYFKGRTGQGFWHMNRVYRYPKY